jgi:endonuclease/exonuclease/phosphatase family metal-dependent hydrolase
MMAPAPAQSLPAAFTSFSLNLRFGLADDGENSWCNRLKCFPALFKEHAADFIAVQEANDFQIKFIAETLYGYDFIGQRQPAPTFWQNNVIFYKRSWQCLEADHFFLSPTPDIPSRFTDSRWPRQCTMGLFGRENIQLIHINTHFDFEPEVQVKSAHIILDRLLSHPPDIPVILTGDFNSQPQSPCHQVFTGQYKPETFTGPFFTDAFKAPYSGTHHGFSGQSDDKGHIDWILFRGGLNPLKAEVINKKFEGIYPSDHFPVWATFDFAAGARYST